MARRTFPTLPCCVPTPILTTTTTHTNSALCWVPHCLHPALIILVHGLTTFSPNCPLQNDETRTVFRFTPLVAPVKATVFPLLQVRFELGTFYFEFELWESWI